MKIYEKWLSSRLVSEKIGFFKSLILSTVEEEQFFVISGNDEEYWKSVKNGPNWIQTDTLLNPVRQDGQFEGWWWVFLKKLGYQPKHGYRYPLKILIGSFCSTVLIYNVIQWFLNSFLAAIQFLRYEIDGWAEAAPDVVGTLQSVGLDHPIFGNVTLQIMIKKRAWALKTPWLPILFK